MSHNIQAAVSCTCLLFRVWRSPCSLASEASVYKRSFSKAAGRRNNRVNANIRLLLLHLLRSRLVVRWTRWNHIGPSCLWQFCSRLASVPRSIALAGRQLKRDGRAPGDDRQGEHREKVRRPSPPAASLSPLAAVVVHDLIAALPRRGTQAWCPSSIKRCQIRHHLTRGHAAFSRAKQRSWRETRELRRDEGKGSAGEERRFGVGENDMPTQFGRALVVALGVGLEQAPEKVETTPKR